MDQTADAIRPVADELSSPQAVARAAWGYVYCDTTDPDVVDAAYQALAEAVETLEHKP